MLRPLAKETDVAFERKSSVNLLTQRKRSIAFELMIMLTLTLGPLAAISTATNSKEPNPKQDLEKQGKAQKLKVMSTSRKAPISGSDRAELSNYKRRVPLDMRLKSASGQTASAETEQNGKTYIVLNLEFETSSFAQNFKAPDAFVITRFANFVDVWLAPSDKAAETIAAAPGLIRAEIAGLAAVPPPPTGAGSTPSRGEEGSEAIVRGGIDGLTGKGTIIAVVDSGVDFRNPDFITYDAAGNPTSRIRYMWDTTSDAFDKSKLGSKAPLSYPGGASVGTLYTREQLTAELRATTPSIPASDLIGHGTACAGVAAGNGNNGKGRQEVIGVAPEADIIAVRIGGTPETGIYNCYLLGAIAGWLDKVAGATPMVVSCSFGGHKGGHDGALVGDRQLNARFPLNAKGRAMVVAAGNEAADGFHAQVSFKNTADPGRLVWASTAKEGATIDVFFDNNDSDDLSMAPAGTTKVEIDSSESNPFTKQFSTSLKVGPGPGGLFLFNKSGKQMKADVYIRGGAFDKDFITVSTQVATPGSAENVITVGSYDWNAQFNVKGRILTVPSSCDGKSELTVGALSCYSNPGYSRRGSVKPEIVAPGEYYHASYAKTPEGVGVAPDEMIPDTSGNYALFNGTSAATPYTAGVLALVMQKNPTITLGQIRRLLQTSGTNDRFTLRSPNVSWGYGKLDLQAVRKMISMAGSTALLSDESKSIGVN